MAAPILLLADLHLPNTASPLRSAFRRFLEGPAQQSAGVYILGDLFETWIGDTEGLRDYASEAAALKRLAARGVPVFFMHGNRDFLVGERFAHEAGLRLLHDPQTVDLAGVPTLLSHGDQYCIDDLDYQRWRRFSRNGFAQALFRRLPETLRRRIAGAARSRSDSDKRNKPDAIMDVNPDAIVAALHGSGLRRLIHGHTHRPAEHAVVLPEGLAERIVLADWRPGRLEYLVADDSGLHRESLPA